MSQQSLIPEDARAMIGKEWQEPVGRVSERDIRRFAFAIDDPSPLYADGIVAPPLFYFALSWAGEVPLSGLGADGLPVGGGLLPKLNTSGTMFGGSEVEFFRPMRPGDVVSVRHKVADIYERRTRSGGLAFIIMENTYLDQQGQPLLKERATYIGRE